MSEHRCERDHHLIVAWRSRQLLRRLGLDEPWPFSYWPRDVSEEVQLRRWVAATLRHIQNRPNGSDFVELRIR